MSGFSEQNIIKKVSGQKFVYKFVTFPDPNSADGVRSPEDAQRLIGGEKVDASVQSKASGGGGASVASLSKSLHPQRSSPSSVQRSSRNDYMKSGLYSTFTIQSLQTPCKTTNKAVKTELPVENTPKPSSADRQEVSTDCPVFVILFIYFVPVGSSNTEHKCVHFSSQASQSSV